MPKYVSPWNVGGGMKANAYYGSKLLTRRKRRGRKTYRQPSSFDIFLANLAIALLKGFFIVWAIITIGVWLSI